MLFTKTDQKSLDKNPIEAITEERPDLKGKIASANMYGSNSGILVAGDEIFKVPHSQFDAWRVNHEIQVLQHLQDRNLPVPSVTFASKKYVLFGMTRVPGEPMDAKLVKKLPSDQHEKLARSLGAFMAEMELAFVPRPTEFGTEYNGAAVDRTPYPAGLKEAFKKIADHNLVKMWGEDGVFLYNLLSAYNEKFKDGRNGNLAMSHCDLHGSNVFFDRKQPDRISAVIDFEIAGFRPPEQGFREMWKKYDSKFVRFVLDEYSRQRGQDVSVADVAAALCNIFLIKGGYDPRKAVQELRAGFPELAHFTQAVAVKPGRTFLDKILMR